MTNAECGIEIIHRRDAEAAEFLIKYFLCALCAFAVKKTKPNN
jgi:hypothetical protein